MKSVADELRRRTLQTAARMTAGERVALALRLGDDDLALYRASQVLSAEEARTALRRTRAIGRMPSRSHDPDAA